MLRYGQGKVAEKRVQVYRLLAEIDREAGLCCPQCGAFAGRRMKEIAERHSRGETRDIKKTDFVIASRHVYMYLLLHPAWLQGAAGSSEGVELGGWAGAEPESTAAWYRRRQERLSLIEVRGRVKLAEAQADQQAEEDQVEEEAQGEDDGAST